MQKKKNLVMLPDELFYRHYTGVLTGKYFSESNVFNVFSDTYINNYDLETLGIIFPERPKVFDQKLLIGWWEKDKLSFTYQNEIFEYKIHSLLQNIFSRNTGILESDVLNEKCALIIGCGSVGSLVALELARSGVGKFVLIDNDILEYHNICRHQCSILEVGQFKSIALKKKNFGY